MGMSCLGQARFSQLSLAYEKINANQGIITRKIKVSNLTVLV
jgi:hypothetical protein